MIKQAEAVLIEIEATYDTPLASIKEVGNYAEAHGKNPLRAFSESCRADLGNRSV